MAGWFSDVKKPPPGEQTGKAAVQKRHIYYTTELEEKQVVDHLKRMMDVAEEVGNIQEIDMGPFMDQSDRIYIKGKPKMERTMRWFLKSTISRILPMWTDEQAKAPVCYCEICGGEIYGDGICLRCERRKEMDFDGD